MTLNLFRTGVLKVSLLQIFPYNLCRCWNMLLPPSNFKLLPIGHIPVTFKAFLNTILKLLGCNQDHSSKNQLFFSQILIKPRFWDLLLKKCYSHQNSIIYNIIWVIRRNYVSDVINRGYDLKSFFSYLFILRRLEFPKMALCWLK